LEEKRREKKGVYVRSDVIRSTVSRHVGSMIDGFEADLAHWAEELSAETGGSVKELKHKLRNLFRGTREKLARHSRELQNELPDYDEEAIDSEDDASAV
jgi:gas vesicle protein